MSHLVVSASAQQAAYFCNRQTEIKISIMTMCCGLCCLQFCSADDAVACAAAPAVVTTIRAAPVEAPVQPSGMRPLMVNVSRGGMGGSTTLVTRSQGSGFISINRMPEASVQSTSQSVPIRRCIF